MLFRSQNMAGGCEKGQEVWLEQSQLAEAAGATRGKGGAGGRVTASFRCCPTPKSSSAAHPGRRSTLSSSAFLDHPPTMGMFPGTSTPVTAALFSSWALRVHSGLCRVILQSSYGVTEMGPVSGVRILSFVAPPMVSLSLGHPLLLQPLCHPDW